MEPYLITCKSCTARLKVTNEALIGQRLACPKCQTMIEVVAPEGYIPKQVDDSAVVGQSSESALSGNFEDIDSLLANAQPEQLAKQNKPSPKSKPKPTPQKTNPQSTLKPVAPAQTSRKPQRPSEAAPIPDSQWDSESSKQKKRVLQIVMLSLVAIAAIGTGVWALLGSGSSETTVVENTQPLSVPEEDGSTTVDTPPAPNEDATTVAINEAETNIEATTDDSATVSPSELPPPSIADTSAGQASPPPIKAGSTTKPPAPTTAKNSQPPSIGLGTPSLPDNDTNETPTADDTPDSPLIASTENSLGKLSEVLKGQGTSLKQIEDIAVIQKERALVGTPAYLIKRPNHKEIQIERQLSAELSGWKLDNVPLIDAIKDLEMLSNIPVTFDPQMFRDRSVNITKPISMKVEAITFQTAFETLLTDAGLSLRPTATGLMVTAVQAEDVTTKSYPQNFCTNENSIGRLRQLIIAVTEIKDWDDNESYQLEVSADSVTVSHGPQEQNKIADLLRKLNAAANYKSDPAALKTALLPLALKAESSLAASPNLKAGNPYRNSMRIGSLFRRVRQATNLVTIIDWENLSRQGWYPNTTMPGRVDEPTNQKLLDQLGHAMEATSIVVGPDTVMLTTFENAGKQSDIEVYSVGEVIDTKMTPPQLDQLMTETLGVDQLSPPNAVVIYFAECKCLVANAPQITQRQISSIVEELAGQPAP